MDRATTSVTSAASVCAAAALVLLVRGYQATLGPLMGGHCRFTPTCSNYAIQALREHGPLRGSWLATRRILKCHPFGAAGHDPVPDRSTRESH